MSDSWWSYYEQGVVILSLCLAILTAGLGFRLSKLPWKERLIVSLTWDFSRSWATNVSSIAAVAGVAIVSAVTTDFKPFSQASIKSSYAVTTVLMGAIVIAAPSLYTLLQKKQDNQMVGSVGGFILASLCTIWGTIAQLLLQGALLITFVFEKPPSRFALLLVPLILLYGLILLVPYSIKSIQVALANETAAPPPAKPAGEMSLDRVRPQTDAGGTIAPSPVTRRVAML